MIERVESWRHLSVLSRTQFFKFDLRYFRPQRLKWKFKVSLEKLYVCDIRGVTFQIVPRLSQTDHWCWHKPNQRVKFQRKQDKHRYTSIQTPVFAYTLFIRTRSRLGVLNFVLELFLINTGRGNTWWSSICSSILPFILRLGLFSYCS